MDECERWKRWERQNVKIILKNDFEYNGKCVEVHDSGNGLIWFSIVDKFGKFVTFTVDEIKVITEARE